MFSLFSSYLFGKRPLHMDTSYFVSNGYVAIMVWIYFFWVNIYFLQYYYYDLCHRIITLHLPSNKFGISLMYGMFMSVSVILMYLFDICKNSVRDDTSLFAHHVLGIAFLSFFLRKHMKVPRVGNFVILNTMFAIKEIIYQNYKSESNTYLSTMINILFGLLFIKYVFGAYNKRILMLLKSRPLFIQENPRLNRSRFIEMFYPREKNTGQNIRRPPIALKPLELIDIKKWGNALFYIFEIIFDNLFILQHSKNKIHLFHIETRAFISPVFISIVLNTIFHAFTITQWLTGVSIGVMWGLVNLICVRRRSLYKYLNIYNVVVAVMCEGLLLYQMRVDSGYYNEIFVSNYIVGIVNIIAVTMPTIIVSIAGACNRIEGITFYSNILAYSLSSFFMLWLNNILDLYGTTAGVMSQEKFFLAFNVITAILPYSLCLLYKRNINGHIGITLSTILPMYYAIKYNYAEVECQ